MMNIHRYYVNAYKSNFCHISQCFISFNDILLILYVLAYTRRRNYGKIISNLSYKAGVNMCIKEAIIKRINEICFERGMAVNKLANLSGITPSTVYSVFDADRKDIGIVLIKKICDGLEITLQDFFTSEIFDELEQELI